MICYNDREVKKGGNNMQGKKFNKLTIIKQLENDKRYRKRYFCKCDCGNYKSVLKDNLINGITKSCGCMKKGINKSHGKSKHPLYVTWSTMKKRCYNKKSKDYKNYGARGIIVCDRWLDSIDNFIEDMGERPKGHTLDRVDVNGNYEPNNCKWSNSIEQRTNTRRNVYYMYKGQEMTLTEWSEILPLTFNQLRYRLKEKGLSIEEALKDVKR